MAWLRIDDGFTEHPKVIALGTAGRRWTWMRILTYTCRYQSPKVPSELRHVIPEANAKYLRECVELGLIDEDDDGRMTVHDWHIYNAATVEERVAAYLLRNPLSTANDVHRAIGGKRELVIAEVTKQRNRAGLPGSPPVPDRFPPGTPAVPDQSTLPVPLAGAREPDPGPGPGQEEPTAADQELDQVLDLQGLGSAAAEEPSNNEPPSDPEVDAAVAALKDSDHKTINRILPLARALSANLFGDVLQQHADRIAAGRVRNHTGLLIQLLETAVTELEHRAVADERAVEWTIEDQIAHAATSYAQADTPWEAAAELLALKISRLAPNGAGTHLFAHALAAWRTEHARRYPEQVAASA